jgi:hypothetical protein
MAIGAYCGFHLKIARKKKDEKYNDLKRNVGFICGACMVRKMRQKKWSEYGLIVLTIRSNQALIPAVTFQYIGSPYST